LTADRPLRELPLLCVVVAVGALLRVTLGVGFAAMGSLLGGDGSTGLLAAAAAAGAVVVVFFFSLKVAAGLPLGVFVLGVLLARVVAVAMADGALRFVADEAAVAFGIVVGVVVEVTSSGGTTAAWPLRRRCSSAFVRCRIDRLQRRIGLNATHVDDTPLLLWRTAITRHS
jgi:hypothetical protein